VLPYLSSSEARWDGLLAEAFLLPAEMEEYILPAETDISLVLFTGGAMRLESREVRTHSSWAWANFHSGDMNLTPGVNVPYELRWRSLSPSPSYTFELHLNRGLLVRTVEELAGGDATRLTVGEQGPFRDPLLTQVAFALWRELREGAPTGRLFAGCATQMLTLHLVRHYSSMVHVAAIEEFSHRLTHKQLQRVTAYIRDHASQDLTLEVLAQQTGFSSSHFARLFRQTTGESPHQVVRRERLVLAQRLLASTNLPLAQVAAESGFGNQSYFTRVFTSFLRVTPLAYRRECRI
jgi:AraC family transcriptional regulator